MSRTTPVLASMAGLLLILAGCSAAAGPSPSEAPTPPSSSDMPMGSDDHAEGFAWGEPSDASAADRVIEIRMLDALRFEPAAIDVKVGETVTFKVLNAGQIQHDFTLGDEMAQAEHEAEMAEGMGGMGHGEPNVMTLDPGASGEMTWTFSAPMSVLYGCHVPGHYDAGMVGTVTIAGA